MKKYYLLSACLISMFFFACKSDDLKAIVPAYLSIEDITVKTTPDQGSTSDNIKDATVFINGQSLGTFELPFSIPIQNTGNVNLKIRAGIFNNGQSNDREDYPFYTTYNVDTTFIPEAEMKLTPEVEYFSTAIFDNPWSGEDFESGINFEYDPESDTTFVRVLDPAESFEGASGLAYLTEDHDFFEAWSPTFVNIDRQGTTAYLELNYKSTHNFVASIYVNGQSIQTAIAFFRSRANYTKIYIKLGPVFFTNATATNYTLALGITKPKGEIGKFYLDNVKLVNFR